MKNRLCKSVPNKFVSVSENVDVSDVVQTGVDCSLICVMTLQLFHRRT